MFGRYGAAARVTAVEPDPDFSARAAAPAAAASARITLVDGSAEKLPMADASVDAAVVCLVLCSVRSVPTVLGELRRVVRPGGEIRFLEHVCSDRVVSGFFMRAFNWLWRLLNGQGCNMHRRPLPAIRAAGFEIVEIEPFKVFTPGIPAFPMRRIVARSPRPDRRDRDVDVTPCTTNAQSRYRDRIERRGLAVPGRHVDCCVGVG